MPAISLTTLGSAYTQNFDTLSNTAGSTTNNLTLNGWSMTETGGGQRDNEQYGVDTGASTTGDTYSYGAAAATDRALGGLRSGTLIPNFGVSFTNNTGATITSLDISFVGEQWRLGTAARTDQLNFEYSLNATDLVTGTWTNVAALNFVTPDTATTGAKNGNAAADRTALSATISSLSIPNGATFWIRWTDIDASGADDGLAIDDFSLTPQAAPGVPNLSINDVSQVETDAGTTIFTFTVSLSAPAPAGGVTFDIATADGTATTADNDYVAKALTGQTIAAGATTYTFDVTVNGDVAVEVDQSFFVNVTNVVGANVADGQGQGTIVNDDIPGAFSVNDATVLEGAGGSTPITFTVSRGAASNVAASVHYVVTLPGGAGGADLTDLAPGPVLSGDLSFAANETSKTITLQIAGDGVIEPDETFTITLSAPTNGATLADDTGIGTIQNDDSPPVASVNDVIIVEGQNGVTYANFTISLSLPANAPATVDYATSNGSATAGSDYLAVTGTVSFAVGESSKSISVPIVGDTVLEANETFTVTLGNPTGATIGDGSGAGTITNDDAPGYFALQGGNFSEDWTDIGRITANDDWSNINYVRGYLGDVDPAGADTGVDPRTLTGANPGAIDVIANLANTTSTSGGVGEFQLANPTIGLQGSGTADAPAIVLFMDSRGRTDVRLTATLRDIDTTSDNAVQQVAVQYRTDPNGSWTNVPGGYFADVTSGPSLATLTTALDVTLPAGANNAATLQIRILTTNAASNDEWVGIDDILVSSNLGPPSYSVADSAVIEGNGGTTPISFIVTRAGDVSAAGTVGYTVDLGSDGFSAAAADFASPLIGTVSFGIGEASKLITLDVNGDLLPEADEGFTISLYNPSSGSLGDATATGTIVNDDGPPPLVTINDVSQAEGDAGTTIFTFTVIRSGGTTGFSIDYHTIAGTAGDPSDYIGIAGTLVFAENENSKTIDVAVKGDTAGEHAETFTVKLDNPLGAVIADSVGTGTILNDDVIAIHELQGASHVSPFLGESVKTRGIVTARDNNGFWIQTPDAEVDGDLRTSEGIFVFTSGPPPATAAIGNLVTITATLSEFASAGDLSVTELTGAVITVDSTGNALPSAVLVGAGGRVVPNAVYDDDGFTSFDIATDGLDFYESLEGMRVTVEAPRAVSNTNSFGETFVVASNGAGATGINARGGITISDGDMNPERILLDADPDLFAGYAPNHSIGDLLGNVTGIFTYAFSSYRVIATEAVAVSSDVTLGLETTSLMGGPGTLTIASYNVENLDPTDSASKFQQHALDIVLGMGSPDIIGLQEVQDADGAGGGGNLSGAATAQALIDAIVAAGGPTYLYVEVAPSAPGTTGGEPGGNIRPGYLYNPARVSYVPGSAFAIDGAPYSNSRKPLVADFVFLGETVTVVDMHLTSRLGSDGLFGANQPPINAGDASRLAQAQGVRDYLDTRFGPGGGDNVVVLGDMNSFYFEAPSNAIEAGGAYTNLYETLALSERYSAIFEGNLQGLDNIIVSANLYGSARFDPVHRTSEQPDSADRPSDHDPVVAALVIDAVPVAAADAYQLDEDGSLAVGGAGVLANDSDADGSGLAGSQSGLSAILVDGPDHAAAFVLNADGTFLYVPTANFNGTDSFTYKPNDGRLDGNTVTVALTVAAVNDTPVGAAESYNVVEDSTLFVPAAGVIGNDSDVDGPALSASLVTGPAHATLFLLNPDGSFTYAPVADYFGPDSFTYRPSDGLLLGDPVTVTIDVIPADDAAIARNDGFQVLESGSIAGNVFADNGSGADSDPDSPLVVQSVNGVSVSVGQQVLLPSGALLTVNANGNFVYDPNGAFDDLTAPGTGALNTAAQDAFTYSLVGGGTATVLVGITGERSAEDLLSGGPGNDNLAGNGFNDSFFLQQGGNDSASGNGGNDGFYFGAAMTNADKVDGGLGTDSLALQGNYPLLLLGDVNVDVLVLLPGNDTRFGDNAGNFYDYKIVTNDSNVPGGGILTIVAGNLRPGEDFVFDGSAETDGGFRIFAGQGVDTLTGGAGNDGFFFGADGNLTAGDRINGGAGTDTIALRGPYAGANAIVFQNASFTNIEAIALLSGLTNQFGGPIVLDGFDYDLTLANGNLGAGQRLDVVATGLAQGETLRLDGRAELDGSLRIFSGAGDDMLYGSAGADLLSGGLGADRLEGGPGSDTYLYRSVAESNGFSRDTIAGFAAGDRIDLSAIDADPAGPNSAFSFIGTGAFTGVAGQLRYGMQGADALVQGDVNGDGVADLVILVENWTPVAGDFVL